MLIYLFSRLLVKKLKRILKNQGHCWAISGLFTIVCIVVVIKYGGSDGKESACDERDWGSIPGSGRSSGEENGYPTPVYLPGVFYGLRSLVVYSP